MTSSEQPIEDLDWEEWDSSNGLSFTHHCLAGSFAGVAEHTLLYPLDTVKTCWQSQVLHRVASAAGGSTNGSMAGCEPCSVHQTVNKFTPSAAGSSTVNTNNLHSHVTAAASSTNATNIHAASQQQQQQSIWSTMKHLMRHGSHHHQNGGVQFSHAHVTTLANGTTTTSVEGLAPNVVDLTNNNNNSVGSSRTVHSDGMTKVSSANNSNNNNTTSTSRIGGKKQQRPWSKSARMVRGATLQDIAPSLQPSFYNTSGAASNSTSAASLSSMEALGNTHLLDSKPTNNTTTVNNTGFKRLWRGVQTMFVGCIPAHALYFSSYEIVKSVCLNHNHTTSLEGTILNNNNNDSSSSNNAQQHHVGIDTLSPTQAMFAGGVATLLHDFIMTPMDTMKQRMQLGHYYNLRDAFCSIVWGDRVVVGSSSGKGARMGGEGWRGLYRSFPITVMTNVPYGMIMMTTNEWLRGVLEDGIYGFHPHSVGDEKPFHFITILLSGMGAGTVASAVTAPLDRVKTRLQTQRMGMMIPSVVEGGGGGGVGGGGGAIMEERALAAAMGERKVCPKMAVQDVKSALFPSSASTASSPVAASKTPSIPRPIPSLAQSPFTKTYYTTPIEAFQSIVQEEGLRGLFRGTLPRVALHAPSVAISWTAYEMAKGWLLWLQ